MIKRIGVLTGGGDAPGLNAVIRAVVKTAVNEYGWEVLGIEDGYEGLLGETRTRPLRPSDVQGLLPRGGTILGTRNRGHFAVVQTEGQVIKPVAIYEAAVANITKLGIDALVVIGGEGTQGIAYELHQLGVPIVGIPKTIDNDLACTELTFGFDTALEVATEALDRLHTTAESHDRVMVLEVMGRHAGWIALEAGIAGGADVILIPEIPFYIEKAASKVLERERNGHAFSIVVVAEGAAPVDGTEVYQEKGDAMSEGRLGGIGHVVADALEHFTSKETRVVVLGHLQRGGSPTAFDRILSSAFGVAAVQALATGEAGKVVTWNCGMITTCRLDETAFRLKRVPLDCQLVKTARRLGITLAGEDD
ncbi:MAG: 6-phosphofructokinase [Acidobacteria bacterium]|nr:6-phosphofructokinase [Acidobacteriota bacterium]